MGILTKVSELNRDGELVFGLPASGKSSYVVQQLKGVEQVLWLYTNNANALHDVSFAANWIAARVDDVQDLQEVIFELNSGSISPNVIVIDGIEGLRDFVLDEVVQKDFVSQQDWGKAGQELDSKLRSLRKHTGSLFGIVNIVQDEETGNYRFATNPDVTRRIMSLFGEKRHIYTRGERDEDGEMVVSYHSAKGSEATNLVNLR